MLWTGEALIAILELPLSEETWLSVAHVVRVEPVESLVLSETDMDESERVRRHISLVRNRFQRAQELLGFTSPARLRENVAAERINLPLPPDDA